ncbi:MAG: hypothetical protein BV456_01715 [Thermoplasmata archaeon M8B2D]|nr:MAG: hypothetical protein BV456_01715 [Thermoplasmata archaeon M8B2D]
MNKIITQVGNFETKNKYFGDASDLDTILTLINEQERPLKFYSRCDFNGILVIEKEDNHINFLMNVMTAKDRELINAKMDNFIEELGEKNGCWLYDLENDIPVYDYQLKKSGKKSEWSFYKKEDLANSLVIDSNETTPMRLYNSTNRSSLYWGIYLINTYMSNPLGNLADEFGVETALKFVNKMYNLTPFSQFYLNRTAITNAVQIWEKENDVLDRKYLKTFNKIYKDLIEEEEEEIIDPKKVGEEVEDGVFLTLSENGEVFLSDILTYGILDDFFPVKIDIVLDPRIVAAYLDESKLILVMSVSLDERIKNIIKDDLRKVRDSIEFKLSSDVLSLVSVAESLSWKNFLKEKFGEENPF